MARLADHGWAVEPALVPRQQVALLAADAERAWETGRFHRAGIGRGDGHRLEAETRSEWITWVDEQASEAQRAFLAELEGLRLLANRVLFLGLFDYEAQLAIYPPGTFYRRHLDRFRNDGRRVLTTILYLDSDWRDEDGGQLRLEIGGGRTVEVLPEGGTFVTFLSDRFWHEVVPTRRRRTSWSGWFRQRL